MNLAEPASFKDPAGRVFTSEGRVFRRLTARGRALWRDLHGAGLLPGLEARGLVPRTWETEPGVLEHEKVPLLSYPYEWPPLLLKQAALLHLSLLEELIPKGFILKDATPFNVLFRGVRPVFIDLLSIERRADGDPWAGYGQFCDTMLYPLMLHAYKGVPYHDWLRGSLGGLAPERFAPLFGWRDWLKKGVPAHVKLRAAMHRRFQDPRQVRRTEIQSAGLPAEAILRNVRGLKRLVEGLPLTRRDPSHWTSYADSNSYDAKARAAKESFVARALSEAKPGLVWDIGCNTGRYSDLAAKGGGLVIGFDGDADAVDAFAARCLARGDENLLPLVMDFANPSPDMGWGLEERKSIFKRERPDLILALAVVHHLAVKGNVPLALQLGLFARTARRLVVEFVDREDPMFRQLATNVGTEHEEYSEAEFQRLVGAHFEVLSEERLSPTRRICSLRAKGVRETA